MPQVGGCQRYQRRRMDSSLNSESEAGTFGNSNCTSLVSEEDLVIYQAISDEAPVESSRIKPAATDSSGSSCIKIYNGTLQEIVSKFLSLRRSNSQKSSNSEDTSRGSPREELASELEEDSTHARRGCLKRISQRITVQDEKFPFGRGELEHGHRRRLRFIKGWTRIFKRGLNRLQKRELDEYRRKVKVNGVPIKDVDVRKAEELAGPIHPGNFWYDIQAGFWGVEPGPCLGIIPPCIPELNVPMSRLCSRGNTGILVNGRELHEKDLERLSFRGLPTTPGMAYCISIDGRVLNESSRKYVTCLGMLAPSLARKGRGAGIYMPVVCYLDSTSRSPPIQPSIV